MKTPIQEHGGIYFKRDDLFVAGGANGSKVRIMLELAKGAKGIVTCGDRVSTQIPRAAMVARHLGIDCRIHTASGALTNGMSTACLYGAEVIQHNFGRLSVLKKRAKDDAANLSSFTYIPWGLECDAAVKINAAQIKNQLFPAGVKQIVVCVGSGMTLAGLLAGMIYHMPIIPVLGICIGGEVEKRLDKYAPAGWRMMVKLDKAIEDYHSPAPISHQQINDIPLDPYYEAKCFPYLRKGDLLWIVGHR